MKRTFIAAAIVLMSIGFAHPLLAQSGCVNSPEDPTVVLALVAGAAAIAVRLRAGRQHNH